jgi:hypothetical protein
MCDARLDTSAAIKRALEEKQTYKITHLGDVLYPESLENKQFIGSKSSRIDFDMSLQSPMARKVNPSVESAQKEIYYGAPGGPRFDFAPLASQATASAKPATLNQNINGGEKPRTLLRIRY